MKIVLLQIFVVIFYIAAFALTFSGIGVIAGVPLGVVGVQLPVEFDASKRAKKKIDELKLASKSEQDGVKSMLSAAAFTYVASVLESLFQLLRLVLRFRDREDR